jgi:hypothetical protein
VKHKKSINQSINQSILYSNTTDLSKLYVWNIPHFKINSKILLDKINIIQYYTIIVFCWVQCEFLWTLKTIFTEAFRLRWILISKVHKNSYWPMKSERETKSPRCLQISVWLLQARRLHRTWWLLVNSKVTLIRRFWLDEIPHYLYVHWSNRNRIHVILFIDFIRKRKWNQVNTSINQTISNFTECQVTAW